MTGRPVPLLEAERLLLRAVEQAELDPLYAVRCEPGVTRWWGTEARDVFAREALGHDPDVVTFAIDVGGVIVGAIQLHEEATPEFRHAGIDIFLGDRWRGRGLGRDAVARLVEHTIDDLCHHRITIDPAAANEPAIRCYAAVGFRPVGVLRQYQRFDDGTWHDGLLMDLLASDLD